MSAAQNGYACNPLKQNVCGESLNRVLTNLAGLRLVYSFHGKFEFQLSKHVTQIYTKVQIMKD